MAIPITLTQSTLQKNTKRKLVNQSTGSYVSQITETVVIASVIEKEQKNYEAAKKKLYLVSFVTVFFIIA